jgi:hypothetical protein
LEKYCKVKTTKLEKKKKKGKLITSIIFPLTVKKEKEKEKVMQILTQFYQFLDLSSQSEKTKKKDLDSSTHSHGVDGWMANLVCFFTVWIAKLRFPVKSENSENRRKVFVLLYSFIVLSIIIPCQLGLFILITIKATARSVITKIVKCR